jgi:hypothetical protein
MRLAVLRHHEEQKPPLVRDGNLRQSRQTETTWRAPARRRVRAFRSEMPERARAFSVLLQPIHNSFEMQKPRIIEIISRRLFSIYHEDYSATWAAISRRNMRVRFFVCIILLLAVIGDLLFVRNFFWSALLTQLIFIIFACLMVAIVCQLLLLCPRCHKRFYATGLYSNPSSNTCLHCGLRYGQPSSDRKRWRWRGRG